jgi:hypothetical protein
MKTNISILFFIIIIARLSVRAQEAHLPIKKPLTEKMVLAKIRAIPEVRAYLKETKRDEAMLMIARNPEPGYKYYWIKVGVNNLDMFRTSYDFYVDPKTSKITIWDQLDSAGSNISLRKWRYWRNRPGYYDNHYYKNGELIVWKP